MRCSGEHFDYNWQYINKQSVAGGGVPTYLCAPAWPDRRRQFNESSGRDTFYRPVCVPTNIFIIDRFHNSTDIFVPLNCIQKKMHYDRNERFLIIIKTQLSMQTRGGRYIYLYDLITSTHGCNLQVIQRS